MPVILSPDRSAVKSFLNEERCLKAEKASGVGLHHLADLIH